MAIEPSPTADATRLIEECLTSPAAMTPGMLVSSEYGRRSRGQGPAKFALVAVLGIVLSFGLALLSRRIPGLRIILGTRPGPFPSGRGDSQRTRSPDHCCLTRRRHRPASGAMSWAAWPRMQPG